MKRLLPLAFCIAVIMLLRLSNLSIRLSDTNIYFYTAYEILNGKLLYKDIFFTNFPLFPYISSLYLWISNKNILFYYFTATIEICIISLLIYFIVYKQTKIYSTAVFSSLLYLLSFMVLSTSEHQTGVFLASLSAIIAYIFWHKKSYIVTGIFLAIAILIKAYFLPIILSFFFSLLLQKQYKIFLQMSISFIMSLLFLLSPFIFFAQQEIYTDIVTYSLTRLAGVSKTDILWFIITHDFFFFILLIFNLFNFKKNVFFGCISFFSICFFLFYTDSYYLYFNFIIPFLCLSLPFFLEFLKKQLHFQKFVFPTILIIFLGINVLTYMNSYRNLGKISNTASLTKSIEEQKPTALYGVNDISPALAYMTNTPMLNGIVDTNESIFRKNFLNANALTKDAIKQKALIISHGAFYPHVKVAEEVLDGIFDKQLIKKYCKPIISIPVFTEGIVNRINLFTCNPK